MHCGDKVIAGKTESGCSRQHICKVDNCRLNRNHFCEMRLVVILYWLNKVLREVPFQGYPSPCIGMAYIKSLLLGIYHEDLSILSISNGKTVLLRKFKTHDHLTDVMQQTGNRDLFRFLQSLLLCN